MFLCAAIPLALLVPATSHVRPGLAALLVALYAIFSRSIKLPLGAGSFVPSYLVLVPMFVLLPAGSVPLLAALGLVLGTLVRCSLSGARPEQFLSDIPDAWHTIGPALVLTFAGIRPGQVAAAPVLLGAFAAGSALDLISSTVREWQTETVAPSLQLRVIIVVWAIDLCIAPIGLLIADAARRNVRELLLLLPLAALLMIVNRDRRERIAESRERLKQAGQERERVRLAASRVGDALAARLDISSLGNVVLHAALEAVAADSGFLLLGGDLQPVVIEGLNAEELRPTLDAATGTAWRSAKSCQFESGGKFALAAPLSILGRHDGVVALARPDSVFGETERKTLEAFVGQVERAAAEAAVYRELRVQAVTDPLTGLGNRRKLKQDAALRLPTATPDRPLALGLFDLDGFKSYNDRFGHPAGDHMLSKLAKQLSCAVANDGAAYRLGGDEFCILISASSPAQLAAATEALTEDVITPSCGSVLIPREVATLEQALSLADQRMYQHKRRRGQKRAAGPSAAATSLANAIRIAS